MGLQDMVQGEVGRIVQGQRADGKQGYEGIAAAVALHGQVKQVAYHGHTDNQLHPRDVEGNDVLAEQQRGHGDAPAIEEDIQVGRPRLGRVDAHQPHGEEQDEQQDQEMAEADGMDVPQAGLAKAHAYHEVDDRRHAGKEYRAGHTLAVEHQEECRVDEGASRLALHDDEPHGQDEQEACRQEVPPLGDIEVVRPHVFRHTQCGGELGKLGRLYAELSYLYPRHRALDVVGQEGRGQEQ